MYTTIEGDGCIIMINPIFSIHVMANQEVKDLIQRYEEGTCTPEEKAKVESWYLEMAAQDPHYTGREDFAAVKQRMLTRVRNQQSPWSKWAVAASVAAMIAVSSVGYYYLKSSHIQEQRQELAEIAPGGNHATLTLSGGKTIRLDDLAIGFKTDAGGMIIEKTADGNIRYRQNTAQNSTTEITDALNTVTTPKGGQYQVTLPDGTKVWLNADSRITYPVSFRGHSQREVELDGEAYFEVAKNKAHPFTIKSKEQIATVTGTHLQVSCYDNGPLLTTLAEGKVEVYQPSTKQRQVLKPGEQTSVSASGIQLKQVNAADYIAWKDGHFVFNQTPMKQVLLQIGRWYSMDVDLYNVPNDPFDGEISRNLNLKQLLSTIETASGLKFTTSGRRIMIR